MALFRTPPPSTSAALLEPEEGGDDTNTDHGLRRGQRQRRQRVLFSPPISSQKTSSSKRKAEATSASVPQPQNHHTSSDGSNHHPLDAEIPHSPPLAAAALQPPTQATAPGVDPPQATPTVPIPLLRHVAPPQSQPPITQNAAPSQQESQPATQATLPHPQPAFLPSLDEAHSTYIPSHKWPPKSVRPEYTRVLTSLLSHLSEQPQDEEAWVLLSIFHRSVLPATKGPDLGDPTSSTQLIRDRLRRWQSGQCGELWQEAVATMSHRPKKKSKKAVEKSQEQWNAERAITLAQDGQYTRALAALTSLGMADQNSPDTIAEMQRKHPPPPHPTTLPPVTAAPRAFTPTEVRKAALSFARGSAAGPSGWRPEHLVVGLKVAPGNRGEKTCTVLTKLVNVLAAGKLPATVAPYFCGARLHAAKKKDDGLRPIAVGNILCRLVAKCFATALADKAAAYLTPHQLGIGVQGGAEAVTHAVRQAVQEHPSSWVLQGDLVNAFNLVDRTLMLEAVAERLPECLPWAITCYGQSSLLQFGSTSILSATGLRQGCPLASTFFATTLQPVVESIQQQVPSLKVNAWFHDDSHQVGTLPELETVVRILEREGPPRGIILSTTATVLPPALPKTKLWCPLDVHADPFPLGRGISRVQSSAGIKVLGSPVGYEGFVRDQLQKIINKVKVATEALTLLQNPQIEFALLSSCLALRKFMFFLRTSDTSSMTDILCQFDSMTREAISRIIAYPITDLQWRQAKLPISMGGLGLQAAADMGPVAYATSYLSSHPRIVNLLHPAAEVDVSPSLPQPLLDLLSGKLGELTTVESLHGVTQKMLTLRVNQFSQSLLIEDFSQQASQREIARLRCLGNKHAGLWLTVVASPSLGLNLRSQEFTVALKYRLGCPVYSSESRCPACHQPSDSMGDHALGCGSQGERIARHNLLRDALHQAAAAAALGPVKEGRFLLPGRDARPADLLIPRWEGGKDTALDVTVVSALQQAMVAGSASTDGFAVGKAFDRKVARVGEACRQEGIAFIPVAADTLGGWHKVAVEQIKKLGAVLARHRGEDEQIEVRHLFQRLSLLLMRGNASLIINRVPAEDEVDPAVDGIE